MQIVKIIFSLVFLGTISTSCESNSDVKTLTFAHILPASHPVHKGVLELQKEVKRLSNGKLLVNIYGNGQLGSEREVLELLQIGSIAMTKVSSAAMSNFVPEYKILGAPYIFKNKEHLFKVLESEIGTSILNKGADYWLKGLCFYDAGSRSFYTKEKFIKTPKDLEGMKIRVMSDKMSVAMVDALGGSPTPMSFGELYTALQQGVVDGAENNAPSFVTSRHFELCKFYSLDSHSYVPDVLLIGTKALSLLTKQEQEWIFEAARISAIKQKTFWTISEKESLRILKEAGVQIFHPDNAVFSAKTKSVIDGLKSNPDFEEIITKIEKTK
ncbi:MAG: TRAP transporter substrate-binding protein [Cellulophaga sp.]